MAISYGYFDSINGDRKYNADQMSEYFDGIVSDGVFQSVGGALAVSAQSTPDMSVKVASGRAIINSKWIKNDADITLPIAAASTAYARITSVVVQLDLSNRLIRITTKDGTPSGSPVAPEITENELEIARITVAANTTSIAGSAITDKREYVHGVINQVDWGGIGGNIANQSDLQNSLGLINARIDNIIELTPGSTTGDAELADIRVGADGKTYLTAGAAVRGQFEELSDSFDKIEISSFEQGTYNDSGSPVSVLNRIRTPKFYLNKGCGVCIEPINQKVIVFVWEKDGTFKNNVMDYVAYPYYFTYNEDCFVTVVIAKINSGLNITPSEANTKITVLSEANFQSDKNKKNIANLYETVSEKLTKNLNLGIYQGGISNDGTPESTLSIRCRTDLIYLKKGYAIKVKPNSVKCIYRLYNLNHELISLTPLYGFTQRSFYASYKEDCYIIFTFANATNTSSNLTPDQVDSAFELVNFENIQLFNNSDYIEQGYITSSGQQETILTRVRTQRFYIPKDHKLVIKANNNRGYICDFGSNNQNPPIITNFDSDFIYQNNNCFAVVVFDKPNTSLNITPSEVDSEVYLIGANEIPENANEVINEITEDSNFTFFKPYASTKTLYSDEKSETEQLQAIFTAKNFVFLALLPLDETQNASFIKYNILTGQTEKIDAPQSLYHCNSVAFVPSKNEFWVAPYSQNYLYNVNSDFEIIGQKQFSFHPQGVAYNDYLKQFAILESETDTIHIYDNMLENELVSFEVDRENKTYSQDIDCDNACLYFTYFSDKYYCYIGIYDFEGNHIKNMVLPSGGEVEGIATDLFGNKYTSIIDHDNDIYYLKKLYI